MSDASNYEKPRVDVESPTTAREMDFDDEPQETGTATPTKVAKSPSPKPKVSFAEPEPEEDEAPPAKPPRPMSPQAQAEHTLIEAFPNIDAKVVKAVLMASGGKVEPAFNALLGMSDPDFKPEEVAPPRPPRPTKAQRQLEADEMYARQLAEHYQSSERAARAGYDDDRGPPLPRRSDETRPGLRDEDREHSFFDDDLPVIKENVMKGFMETQSKVNKWITDFKKRIDGEDNDDPTMGPTRQDSPPRRKNFGPSQTEQMYGIRKSSEMGRKSTDKERYDADPRVLDDDFTALELRDEEASQASSSRRPLGNPDLFRPNVAPPQSGPVDEVDAADRNIQRQRSPNSASKSAKWQPLTSVAPDPESEENDPFSLGDSDDEKESKGKDIREADSARLKDAARKSISGGESGEAPKELKANERSDGVSHIDKDAEAILTGKN